MSATAPGPASLGSHAQVAVFRRAGWLPEHSGIADLDALRAAHEADVAAWERAKAAVSERSSEHQANERAVADSARRRAEGEDVAVVKPLPEAARQTELALVKAEADAARDVLDQRNEERCAVIDGHRGEWEQTWKGALGTDQAAIDELQAQIDALRERQRLTAVYLDWLAQATDSREPTQWATVVDRLSEAQRQAIAIAHGPEQVDEFLDEPVRRRLGRFSPQESLLRRAGSHTYAGDDEDEE
jgi:hypothetical protein